MESPDAVFTKQRDYVISNLLRNLNEVFQEILRTTSWKLGSTLVYTREYRPNLARIRNKAMSDQEVSLREVADLVERELVEYLHGRYRRMVIDWDRTFLRSLIQDIRDQAAPVKEKVLLAADNITSEDEDATADSPPNPTNSHLRRSSRVQAQEPAVASNEEGPRRSLRLRNKAATLTESRTGGLNLEEEG